MNPKPSTRLFYCPRCNGQGGYETRCGPYVACHACDGQSIIELDAGRGFDEGMRPWSPSARRYTGMRHPMGRDWLEVVAQLRADMAATLRAYPTTRVDYTEYGFARLCAMRPKAARLRQTDMLAMASRCVGAVEAMRRAA